MVYTQADENYIVTNDILSLQALNIAKSYNFGSFKASSTWVRNFKEFYKISDRKICGEEGLIDLNSIENTLRLLNEKISEYSQRDVFNCDETALFFKCPPNHSLKLNSEERASGKFSKERVTIIFCVSMEGEKINPLLIGKAKNPRGFKNLRLDTLGIDYNHRKKAWMTAKVFLDWLLELNFKMKKQERRILLLLDNAPVHFIDRVFSNIELCFLPPNTTLKTQPLDQGIIRSFKSHYKKLFHCKLALSESSEDACFSEIMKNFKLCDSIPHIIEYWQNVTEKTFVNCFKHSKKTGFNIKIPVKIKKSLKQTIL